MLEAIQVGSVLYVKFQHISKTNSISKRDTCQTIFPCQNATHIKRKFYIIRNIYRPSHIYDRFVYVAPI